MPSLRPQDFKQETDQDKLLAMSCEDVIDYKAPVELKRNSHMEPESESEIYVSYRTIPADLNHALDAIGHIQARSHRLVVKCLTHHAVAILSDIKEIDVINEQYVEILALHGKTGKMSDILDQIETHQYHQLSERSVRGSFCSAQKLVSYFSDRSRGVGMSLSGFIAAGLILSLTTSQDVAFAGVAMRLRPYADHFRSYIQDRSSLMGAYFDIASRKNI